MPNFNKVLLMGNLTRDPELRYAGGGTGGTPICKFGLAVNRQWRTQSGEAQEETCFVDLVVFGRQGETCNEYLSKGRPVFVEGRLSFSSWEDRETGAKRSKLEVVAERVQFLGGRNDGERQSGERQSGGGQREQWSGGDRGAQRDAPSRQQAQSAPAASPAAPSGTPTPAAGGYDFDDIPF